MLDHFHVASPSWRTREARNGSENAVCELRKPLVPLKQRFQVTGDLISLVCISDLRQQDIQEIFVSNFCESI